MSTEETNKKKIVILGGGMGAMATAYGITESPNWQENYDITIYQLGWRIGGKGASGRNSKNEERIEEHGLHVWGGFYENAFRVMRSCYDELNRPSTKPLATWNEAFKPNAMVSWMEDLEPWIAWNNRFPEYSSTPGDGTPMPSLFEGLLRIVEWVIQTYVDGLLPDLDIQDNDLKQPRTKSTFSEEIIDKIESVVHKSYHKLILEVYRHIKDLQPSQLNGSTEISIKIIELLKLHQKERKSTDTMSNGERRADILIDLAIAEVKGIIEDGVLIDGFEAINDIDLKAWFTKHGAQKTSVESGVVVGSYDFIFAYKNGDSTKPLLEAGTGLQMIFRLIMWYKGAIFWKMQAGMGDTVFGPFYEVLKAKGVKFKFFQKVLNLSLSADKKSINSIMIGEQATLKNGTYDPLVDVLDLPCWPSEPLYDQLVEGTELKNQNINLESPWSPWPMVNTYTLEQGSDKDFDIVVLATSLAPINEIGKELIENNSAWKAMMDNVKTTQTQAFQLWMLPTLAKLGWTKGPTVLTGYGHPFETWAEMSQVIDKEEWNGTGEVPGSIAYFCGCLPDADPIPPYSDHQFPAEQTALAKQNAIAWIKQYILDIWPKAESQDQFNWDLLLDLNSGQGEARFNAQYWRANIAPAERYVLSIPNTTKYKLKADQSGYNNLFLAGDWVQNGLNFGCIESATMGGLQASRGICGYPTDIVGE